MAHTKKTISCPECHGTMVWKVGTDTVEYRGHRKSVRLPGYWCRECPEAVFDGDALQKKETAFLKLRAEVEQVLSPDRVASIREKLRLSQRKAGELLGGGPRSFQKYESGEQQVSVPMTNLLRLLEKDPRRVRELVASSGRIRSRAVRSVEQTLRA
jgi:HTH-type transcriptional regulator/antitoxin MqsA